MWSTYALGGWAWCVALLGAARLGRGPGRLIERARDLQNPFYILHQTLIVALAFYLIPHFRGPTVTYVVLVPIAFTITLALALLSTRSVLTRRFFGVRHRGERRYHALQRPAP